MLTLQFTVELKPCILKYYTTRHGPSAHEHCSTAGLQESLHHVTWTDLAAWDWARGHLLVWVMKLGVWHDLTTYNHYTLTTSGHTFTGNIKYQDISLHITSQMFKYNVQNRYLDYVVNSINY